MKTGLKQVLKKSYFFLIIIIVTFSACEEVIQIDLNSSAPKLVAEGLIEKDSIGWIKLSYTRDYFTAQQTEFVNNATVVLTNEAGNSETLTYRGDGLYKGTLIQNNPSDQYTLAIEENGNKYQAVSTRDAAPEIYSVIYEKKENKRPGEKGVKYDFTIQFSDDPKTENYYLIKFWVNDTLETNNYTLLKDSYYAINNTIKYSPMRMEFNENDHVTINLYSIDKESYTYLNQLNDFAGSPMDSSTPYNPKSNFGPDVLGYFMACSSTTIHTVVKPE